MTDFAAFQASIVGMWTLPLTVAFVAFIIGSFTRQVTYILAVGWFGVAAGLIAKISGDASIVEAHTVALLSLIVVYFAPAWVHKLVASLR